MTPPTPAYGIGDILLEYDDVEGPHWIVEEVEWRESINMHLYRINNFAYDYWESEWVLTKWAKKVA